MNFIKKGRGALCALLLALLILLSLPLSASALEGGEEVVTTTAITTAAAPSLPEPLPEEEVEYIPLATLVNRFLGENATELLSGATFLLTLILSLLCRKRILPPLLDAIGTLLGKSRDLSEAISAGQAEESAKLSLLFDEAERMLSEVKAAAARAEEAAEAIRAGDEEQKSAALILREQSALLYELLMSANLPQYQKDRIGELHAAATAALTERIHD